MWIAISVDLTVRCGVFVCCKAKNGPTVHLSVF